MNVVDRFIRDLLTDVERRQLEDQLAFRAFLLSEPPPLVPEPTHLPPDKKQ